jgi:tetratricopeptide (TPR) repeat protein
MMNPCVPRFSAAATAAALWLLASTFPATAQEGTAKEGVQLPDLARVKQEEAREKLERLEETMDRLSRLLAQSEPQNAAKLRMAFKEARDRLLREGMDRIVRYLDAKKLDRAIEDQDRIKDNLQEILDILLEKDVDPRELLKHIRRIRDILTGLDKVVADETKEKMASDDAEQSGATSNALEGDIAKLEDLIRREKSLEGKTADPALAPDDKLPGLAPEQGKLREETAGLRKSDEERAATPGPAEGNAAEGDRTPEGGAPPNGARPPDGAQPPGEGQPPEGGAQPPGRPEPPPAKPAAALDRKMLEKAEQAMGDAEQAMKGADRGRASSKTKEARAALEEAVASGREQLEKLRADREWKKLQEDQDRTKTEAEAIAERMQTPAPLVQSPEGGVPGQSDVQAATQDMQEATSELGAERPRRASRKQADSLDKLKEGRGKTEEALEELQRALRERLLAYLREKFTKMLAEQRAVTRETRSLDLKLRALKAVQGAGTPSDPAPGSDPAPSAAASAEGPEIDRKDRQIAEALAAREAGIGVLADDVIDLLSEDGTTLVFPGVVEEVKRDIANVSGLLSRIETGERTQHIEREVEVAIEEILKALEQAQRSPPPPNPSQGRQSRSGAGPLLPLSAELKMVRSLQARVNERTKVFDLARKPDLGAEDKLQLHAIQKKQKEVETMLRKLRAAAGEN